MNTHAFDAGFEHDVITDEAEKPYDLIIAVFAMLIAFGMSAYLIVGVFMHGV